MKLNKIQLFFISFFLSMFTSAAQGQNQSILKINVGDDQGSQTFEMFFGNHDRATWGMGGVKDSLDPVFIEKESPPLPPDLGVVWRPSRSGVSWGIGFLKYDIKDWTDAARVDTFRLYFSNQSATDADITLTWEDAATLGTKCTAMTLRVDTDYYDMFTQTSLTIPDAGDNGIHQAYIYKNGVIPTQVKLEKTVIPEEFRLYNNYPNPFNPMTTITFDVLKSTNIDISIYSITGEKVAIVVSENLPPGTYSTTWNGMSSSNVTVSSGVYYVRMLARDGSVIQYSALHKIIFVK